MADKEAKVVWYHKGERILEGIEDDKYEIKVLGDGRHQLIINSCKMADIGEVKAMCGELSTEAKLEVIKVEEKPKVEAEPEQETDDSRIKGKFKGKSTQIAKKCILLLRLTYAMIKRKNFPGFLVLFH